jgi:hypothetical protein
MNALYKGGALLLPKAKKGFGVYAKAVCHGGGVNPDSGV